MRRYPVYKDAGIAWLGEIPEHWEMRRLRFACKINPSKSEIAYLPPETQVSFLPMENIGETGTISLVDVRTIDQVWQGYTYFRNGDVLVAKITPCFENGKGALCHDLLHGIGFGTTELHVLRVNNSLIPTFLAYVTTSSLFRVLGIASMYGAAGQQRISDDFVKDFRVVLPPRAEQDAIVAFLDHKLAEIDRFIANKKRLIELLKEQKAVLINRAVTRGIEPGVALKQSGIAWLGEIPAHWEIKKLKYCASIVNGQVDPKDTRYQTMPLIAPNHIEAGTGKLLLVESTHEQGAESGKYLYNVGDVLYSKIRPNLQKACIPPFAGLCSADMYPISVKEDVRPTFLLYFLLSNAFTQFAVERSMRVAMPKINREDLNNCCMILPPLSEQDTITQYIDGEFAKFDSVAEKAEREIELMKEYRTTLISEVVTGKSDVRTTTREALPVEAGRMSHDELERYVGNGLGDTD